MQRTALVTSSTNRLAKAISIALQSNGYRVVLVDGGSDSDAREFTDATSIPVFRWNLLDADDCRAGVAEVEQRIGPIDILVNDASLAAMQNMSSIAIDGMCERGFGRIVNIGPISAAATESGNHASQKADMLALTRSLAQTAAHAHVTVNAIAPGSVDINLLSDEPDNAELQQIKKIPVGRLGTAQDISRMVTFLVDDDAGFITGADFDVDGGQHLVAADNTASLIDQAADAPAANTKLDWSPLMELGVAAIDNAHQALVTQLSRLREVSDGEFEAEFMKLIVNIESDFREEEMMMEARDFPGIRAHREQHARVLAALHRVVPEIMQGNHAQARRALELIPQWLQIHLTTMDAAMVAAFDLSEQTP